MFDVFDLNLYNQFIVNWNIWFFKWSKFLF